MQTRKIPVLPASTFIPDRTFPFAIRRNTRHGSIDLHAHEFVELVVLRRGQATHFSTDSEYTIRSGDVFVIHPGQAHGYRAQSELDLANILYRKEAFLSNLDAFDALPGFRALFNPGDAARFGIRLHLAPGNRKEITSLVDAIDREMTAQAPGHRPLVGGLFTQLAVTLSRLFSEPNRPSEAALLELEPILDHLRRSFDHDLTLADLAGRAGMSVSTLLRRFRTATGTSPVEFLLRLRLERAREILSTTDRRITEIAFDCGFRDSNYFTRQFKRHTGKSPRAYRHSLRYLD